MLLFSTMLDIKDTLSETDFIRLLIEANQDHDNFKDNIIPGDKIKWDGDCLKNSFGDDDLSLKTCKYRDGNIMAARFEKKEPDGKNWTTDYVWNIDDKKMCITLDRVFREGSYMTDEDFSSPSFIKYLIANKFLEDDNDLPILDVPIMIDEDNITLLTDILNSLKEYSLPIVYVSKRYDDNADPLDTCMLAKKLRGVAHVLVEIDQDINPEIRKNSLQQRKTFDGRVSIFFTDKSFPSQTLNSHHEYDNNESGFISAIINDVLHYMNSRKIPSGYTWDEVNYNISEHKLDKRTKDYDEALNEYFKSDDENKSLKNDQKKLQEENNDLRADKYRLEAKNNTLTFAHDTYTDAAITLSLNKEGGEEKGEKFEEFFPGEAKEILLETLKTVLDQFVDRPRRYDVLKAIIDNNDCPDTLIQMGKELENLMISYKDTGMDGHTKSVLKDLGFKWIRHTDHYIFYYHNIERYNATFASTPGANNSGSETAKEIKKKCF